MTEITMSTHVISQALRHRRDCLRDKWGEPLRILCRRCNKQIELGEKTECRINGCHTKHYHAKCWKEMFI